MPTPPLADIAHAAPRRRSGIFLVCFADEILTARSFAGRHDQHVGVGQELLAMGAANAAAGLTQGFPVGASGSRTAVNDAMGARSQIAGLSPPRRVVLVLLFLTGPIADLPKAVLGAVIVAAAVGLVDPPAWRALCGDRPRRVRDRGVTTAGVVAVGVLEAILFAVGLSIVDVVRRSARPHDAVLGWVERLGRWADVSVHRVARGSRRASSSTGSTTASSSPTPATSRPACARRCAPRRHRSRTRSSSTPRRHARRHRRARRAR